MTAYETTRQAKCNSSGGFKGGFALLVVLIAVAIVAVLYFLDLRAIFGPAVPVTEPPSHRPWVEEERIVGEGGKIKLPKAPKPVLETDLILEGLVSRNSAARGTVTIEITPNGKVTGAWSCDHVQDGQRHVVNAAFDGNVDASKTYEDERGEDKSLLYFIAKGKYAEEIYDETTGSSSSAKGVVYVTGWLGSDYTGWGHITLTTDKTWSITYEWATVNEGPTNR